MEDSMRFDDGNEYEPTDSEDEYSEEDKQLLKEVRQGKKRDDETRKEIMGFADSDDAEDTEDDEDAAEFIGESDIEGAVDDDLDIPDAKDWGNKSRNYYNTDFVDPDYSTYNEQEEELAKQEEEEAKTIQLRLAKQMTERDFLLDEVSGSDDDTMKAAEEIASETVKADFSTLSKRQRYELFVKDSPEFPGLISDFHKFLEDTKSLLTPVLDYVKENDVPMIPALEFTRTYQNLVLTYCSNIVFYTLLKAKRTSVRYHPIVQRLVQLKKLLKELKDKYENIIKPQLEALLERIMDGDEFEVVDDTAERQKKSKLAILDQYDAGKGVRGNTLPVQDDAMDILTDNLGPNQEDEGENDENQEEADRRGITYQIAKNKGLTPSRKKELRNPRVKHRSKFRKALIRRKGAVRTVRAEKKRYDGEISGIKTNVIKSVKFKT